MGFPNILDIQIAIGDPQFLRDPELKAAQVDKTIQGPQVISGNWGLTFRFSKGNQAWAVKVFFKGPGDLLGRYQEIHKTLQGPQFNKYFLDFDYQDQGILAGGAWNPLVKMEWGAGLTLGNYLKVHHQDSKKIQQLGVRIRELTQWLETQDLAHGDLQLGNILVDPQGSLKLVDYDGMWVPALDPLGPSEGGHPNFQHPDRRSHWGKDLDHFSLIHLNFGLKALALDGGLWGATGSGEDKLLLGEQDFRDPQNSQALAQLASIPALKPEAEALAQVCTLHWDQIPSPRDFPGAIKPLKLQPQTTQRKSSRKAPRPQSFTHLQAPASAAWYSVRRSLGTWLRQGVQTLAGARLSLKTGALLLGVGLAAGWFLPGFLSKPAPEAPRVSYSPAKEVRTPGPVKSQGAARKTYPVKPPSKPHLVLVQVPGFNPRDLDLGPQEALAEVNPYPAQVFNSLGIDAYEGQNWALAGALFFRALSLDETYSYPHYNLACVYGRVRIPGSPEDPDLLKALGYHLVQATGLDPQWEIKLQTDSDLDSVRGELFFQRWSPALGRDAPAQLLKWGLFFGPKPGAFGPDPLLRFESLESLTVQRFGRLESDPSTPGYESPVSGTWSVEGRRIILEFPAGRGVERRWEGVILGDPRDSGVRLYFPRVGEKSLLFKTTQDNFSA